MSDALDMAEMGAPLDPASLLQVTMTDTEASHEIEEAPLGEIDPSVPEDERNFYMRAYPTFDVVRERKVHCTVCKLHIGTAPAVESVIKMHPILRVTHCTKCHDFYNSGEFSKGEDGSELYCRWCGQGGEVYCCSSCPYVFCKSCITKNLSRGVISDIEQNENWNCFTCSTKILWPLRAQHWALINFIQQQKRAIKAGNYSDAEAKRMMADDRSTCCRLAKAKCGNMSDSLESIDSMHSRRSNGSSHKKTPKPPFPPGLSPSAKRAKTNDELVCTPDLLSMLEPDCQITESPKSGRAAPAAPTNSVPRIMTIQTAAAPTTGYPPRSSAPPPLVLRNTSIKINRAMPAQPMVRRTIIGPRTPAPTAPVYHTINGYRIDLNSAAQHETFRLPNGKLIQVKRQGVGSAQTGSAPTTSASAQNNTNSNAPWQRNITIQSTQSRATITPSNTNYQRIGISPQTQQHPQVVRYQNTIISNRQAQVHNGATQVQVINGTPTAPVQQQAQVQAGTAGASTVPVRPNLLRYIFPDTAIGQARTQLQDQVFNAMEICVHLTNKIQSLTNSNAYKQARNYLEIKELYIHMSYLLTYAIGRFKGLQEKCLGDMRQLGFSNDADCLENGQLAAGADYVAYGQLEDIDLFNTGSSSFHNQVYEYRKSLHANLKDGESEPLPPLFPIGLSKLQKKEEDGYEEDDDYDKPPNNFEGANFSGNFKKFKPKAEPLDDDDIEEITPDIPTMDDNDDAMDADDDNTYGSFADRTDFDDAIANEDMNEMDDNSMANESSSNMQNNPYEEMHAFDRKLTRLIQPYPAIWCTRHPDYGNFEVTRKHWRTIASHFSRADNIKLRWKNIRKRYVRIEKRMQLGKRFHGYFDKATNFLVNRDTPEHEWIEADCGEEDGDLFTREKLDEIERKIHGNSGVSGTFKKTNSISEPPELGGGGGGAGRFGSRNTQMGRSGIGKPGIVTRPIDIHPLDEKIISFVRSHPVLWMHSKDPEKNRLDEQARASKWSYLAQKVKLSRNGAVVALEYRCSDLQDRWAHLYEMYKTFRLKTIKNEKLSTQLELKYSKYLAKLYFLYKIDENDLRSEQLLNLDDDLLAIEPDLEDDDDDDDNDERGNEENDDDDNDVDKRPKIESKNNEVVNLDDDATDSQNAERVASNENFAKPASDNDANDDDKQSVHSTKSSKSFSQPTAEGSQSSQQSNSDNKENQQQSTRPQLKLQEMSDDEDFARDLARAVEQYEPLWNTKHEDYNDLELRANFWKEIEAQLQHYKHKQASDDEDNEIEIVEPKTDTITLDSDNDDDDNNAPKIINKNYSAAKPKNEIPQLHYVAAPHRPGPLSHQQKQTALQSTPPPLIPVSAPVTDAANNSDDLSDYMSAAQSFLASMLEVEISEGSEQSYSSQKSPVRRKSKTKKQPRKKTTNKPNPQLLELERQRLEEIKRNDVKLKMQCAVKLKKVETEYPNVLEMLNPMEPAEKEESLKRKREDSESIEEATESESKRSKSERERESKSEEVESTKNAMKVVDGTNDDVVELLDDSDELEKDAPTNTEEESEIVNCTPSLPDFLEESESSEEKSVEVEEAKVLEEGRDQLGTKTSETDENKATTGEVGELVTEENESSAIKADIVELSKEISNKTSQSEISPEISKRAAETNAEDSRAESESLKDSKAQEIIQNKDEMLGNSNDIETEPTTSTVPEETPLNTNADNRADKNEAGSQVELEKSLSDETENSLLSGETHNAEQSANSIEPEVKLTDVVKVTEERITEAMDTSQENDITTQTSINDESINAENATDVENISLSSSTADNSTMYSSIILLDSTLESDVDGSMDEDPSKKPPNETTNQSHNDKSLEKVEVGKVNDVDKHNNLTMANSSINAEEKSFGEVENENQNQAIETAGTENIVEANKTSIESLKQNTAPTTVENTVNHAALDAETVVANTTYINET